MYSVSLEETRLDSVAEFEYYVNIFLITKVITSAGSSSLFNFVLSEITLLYCKRTETAWPKTVVFVVCSRFIWKSPFVKEPKSMK